MSIRRVQRAGALDEYICGGVSARKLCRRGRTEERWKCTPRPRWEGGSDWRMDHIGQHGFTDGPGLSSTRQEALRGAQEKQRQGRPGETVFTERCGTHRAVALQDRPNSKARGAALGREYSQLPAFLAGRPPP